MIEADNGWTKLVLDDAELNFEAISQMSNSTDDIELPLSCKITEAPIIEISPPARRAFGMSRLFNGVHLEGC